MFTEHGQDQDWISCRIRAIFRNRIGFGYLFLKKNDQDRTVYLFDFYNEISLRVIQDVKNDSGCVFFATVSRGAARIFLRGGRKLWKKKP